ncbi:hypothetical protein KQX54_016935 [Cotesia glomerata]|uniref:Uncharacterized protein n=1 Tax=Cotesia glomerata TaxID=32391 RepID=A0AAV7HV00_COTGL|nr:hypothetical protein KQX54_016935 [Cotesia glomerata]
MFTPLSNYPQLDYTVILKPAGIVYIMGDGSIYVGNKYSDISNQYKYGHPHLFSSAAAFDVGSQMKNDDDDTRILMLTFDRSRYEVNKYSLQSREYFRYAADSASPNLLTCSYSHYFLCIRARDIIPVTSTPVDSIVPMYYYVNAFLFNLSRYSI